MMKTVDITITSDVTCPWSWIGLRKLQQAARKTNVTVDITWKPFLVRHNMLHEGEPKRGNPDSRVGSRLQKAGEAVGIKFIDYAGPTPDTVTFHAVIKMLQEEEGMESNTVTEFQEAVFFEYFTNGVVPDEKGILIAALKVESDPFVYEDIASLFGNPTRLAALEREVILESLDAARRGVTCVPSFAFEGNTTAFSGAQPTSIYSHFLKMYAKERT